MEFSIFEREKIVAALIDVLLNFSELLKATTVLVKKAAQDERNKSQPN